LTADATAVGADEPVRFDASASRAGDAPIGTYEWDLADGQGWVHGSESAEANWSTPSLYSVRLRVTDADGLSDSASLEVRVLRPGEQADTAAGRDAASESTRDDVFGDEPQAPGWLVVATVFAVAAAVVLARRRRL
jgi:hypothetical protein